MHNVLVVHQTCKIKKNSNLRNVVRITIDIKWLILTLITQIISLSVTHTELPRVFISHLVLHRGVVVAPGGVVLSVVGGGVEAVHDLLAVRGEEVAAHCLVSPEGNY